MARSVMGRIVSAFVPGKARRHKVRQVVSFGPIRALKAIREESRRKFKYYLAIVAIAKNEGCYILEWLEYHRIVGVEKVYFYDNESTDNTREILAPYIESGYVEYIYCPGEKRQMPAYHDALARYRNETQWLAVIDLDEFVVPLAMETVPDFLRQLPPKTTQVLLGWELYGSSGHEVKPDGFVIENFQHKGQIRQRHKAIINPRFTNYGYNAHTFCMINGNTVNGSGEVVGRKSPKLDYENVVINHYHCKSWEEYETKRGKGDVYFGSSYDKYTRECFIAHDCNEIYDGVMDKYVPLLKKSLMINGGSTVNDLWLLSIYASHESGQRIEAVI